MSTDQPSKKLEHNLIGPFSDIREKYILLKLQFPQAMKIYHVFHLNLFQKLPINLLTSEKNESASPVIVIIKKYGKIGDILDTRNF